MRIAIAACLLGVAAAPAHADKLGLGAHRVDNLPTDRGVAHVAVTASTSLCDRGKKNCYKADNLVDGKLDTAWCEGDKGDGEGATITLTLDKPARLSGFVIVPHYAKDFARAWDNNRIAKLEVATDAGTGTVELEDLGKWVRQHHTDKETGGAIDGASRDERIQIGIAEQVDFDEPVTTKTVTLTLRGVHRGTVHDTCASEIVLQTAP